MKMGIDARFFGPKTGGGGIGRYVAELTHHLQGMPFDYSVELFLQRANFHESVIKHARFSKTMADVPWYGLKEQWYMPNIVRQSGVTLMHYPHWNVPRFSRIPFIVTIHDLILLDQPTSARTTTRGALLHGLKYAGFRLVLEHAIHASKAIITISDHAKERILHYFNVPEKKITVIPNGVSTPPVTRSMSLIPHGVYEPFILHVGNAYPHKNIELLIRAFATVIKQHAHVQLVLAGKRDVFSRRLEDLARALGITPERIRFIDHPEDELLHSLYRQAHVFVFPSLLEGFGIPPLEALSHNTPVIASNVRPLTDILGTVAHYVDPLDHRDLASALLAHLANPNLLERKLEHKDSLLKTYTWQKTAIATKDLYDRTLSSL